MEAKGCLLKALMKYHESDFYPFHMPGHKQAEKGLDFPNPFFVDITEIEGFDNLHHPEGILKDSMAWAASVYGADKTFYLVNGSTCGLLSAICGCVKPGGKLLMSRNCHKAVYHGVFLNQLQTEYIYPQILPGFGLQGGLLTEDVRTMLISNPDIMAVLVVSPTYDGIVSDIRAIADVVHEYGIPLIVDEAHGAHFHFGREWPVSALELGADVVVQSLHKTLPSFTQTAVLHWKKGYADIRAIEQYLQIFQTSSPSYVLMAGIENCIAMMAEDGGRIMEEYFKRLDCLRRKLKEMKNLRLVDEHVIGQCGVFDLDRSKIVVSTRGTGMDGRELDQILRGRFFLEMEMCGADYVTAITTAWDTENGLKRLLEALLEVDKEIGGKCGRGSNQNINGEDSLASTGSDYWMKCGNPVKVMSISDAIRKKHETVRLCDSEGRVSEEYVYLYPPGIPILAPGEVISREMIDQIGAYKQMGLAVQGLADECMETIRIVKNEINAGE